MVNVPREDAKRIMSCVCAVGSGCIDSRQVAAILYGKDWTKVGAGEVGQATRGCRAATRLGLLVERDDAGFALAAPSYAVSHDPSSPESRMLFRRHVQQFAPFVAFLADLKRSGDEDQAARFASAIHEVRPAVSGHDNVFVHWGLYCGILERTDDQIAISDDVVAAAPARAVANWVQYEERLNAEVAARLRVSELLTPQVASALPCAITQDLMKSITEVARDPGSALQHAGIALEDTLKELAAIRGVPLKAAGGRRIDQIGALAQELRSHKVIAGKHVNILGGLEAFVSYDVLQGYGAFRNMPSHGRSVEDWQRWHLGPEIAWCVVVQVCLTIRSLHEYCVSQKRVY